MRYHDLVEAPVPDPRSFGEITSGPNLYLHYTSDENALRSILANGFHLKRFGATGKRYRLQELTVNDPRGVYATSYDGYAPNDDRPWVIFSVAPGTNVLGKSAGEDESANLKTELAQVYGVVGAALSKILLRAGVQVLHSTTEFIILDPTIIRIRGSSLEGLPLNA